MFGGRHSEARIYSYNSVKEEYIVILCIMLNLSVAVQLQKFSSFAGENTIMLGDHLSYASIRH